MKENPNIDTAVLPQHIAIIMDGNGRWAQSRGLSRVRGHREGAESVRVVVRECRRLGIKVLTLYSFSTENWQRPKREVDALMKLLSRFLKGERREMMERNIRFNVLGEIERFPQSLSALLREVMWETRDNCEMTLNLALSYGGRAEITRAVKAVAEKCVRGDLDPEAITESVISEQLYTASLPDPELLIRTGGEYRVSNFLLWQIAYTELYVTSDYWPDFREEELNAAIADFHKRERRFGKTSEQLRKAGNEHDASSRDKKRNST